MNSLGTRTHEVIAGLRRGLPALSPAPPGTPFATPCGRVDDDLPGLPDNLTELDSRNNRLVQRALEEIELPVRTALNKWGPDRLGICVGSSTSAMDELEKAYGQARNGNSLPSGPELFALGSAEGLIRTLRQLTHITGPASVLSNACASSGKAFASAKRWLLAGAVDAVLVGGADSLCQTTLRGFRALGLLSDQPTRPFSRNRHGISLGEGAAFALLERFGEGPRLLGVGESTDAHHMTSPDPKGRGALAAMQEAIRDAELSASDIDYVNAHGTGTPANDAVEANAIRDCLGSRSEALVVSTKGYVGHTLGTAGATEAIFVLEALQNGWIPASVGADPLDPDLPIHVPTEICELEVRAALTNSFAFGGNNVSLVFGASE